MYQLDGSQSTVDSLRNSSDGSRKQIFRNILWKSSYLVMKLYVVCNHKNRLVDVILMSTLSISLQVIDRKDIPRLSPFAS